MGSPCLKMAAEGILWILCLVQIISVGTLPNPSQSPMVTDDEDLTDEGSGVGDELWNNGEPCEKPCSGPSCSEMSALMENLIDLTVDPCDDFFAFACSAKTRELKDKIDRKD